MTAAQPALPATARLEPQVSDRIRIARTVCIFLMMFVHIQAGVADDVNMRPAEGAFDIAYFVLTKIFGLSSVALLGVVSGYLIVSTYRKLGALALYRSKFTSLVVPLVSWNAVMAASLVGYGLLTGKWEKWPEPDLLGLANAFLALTQWPLVVPLWFLRDLFVCCLFAPLLVAGLRRWPAATFAALAAFAFAGEGTYILQRPQLLLFFAGGIWLRMDRRGELDLDRMAAPLALMLLPIIAMFLAIRLQQGSIAAWSESASLAFDIALRVAMAAAMWRLTGILIATRFGKICRELEPYVFFAFCSHAILFDYGQILLRRAFGNYGSDLFPITFFSLPLAALASAVIALQVIHRLPPVLFLLNAGRSVPAWPPQLEKPAPAAARQEHRRHGT